MGPPPVAAAAVAGVEGAALAVGGKGLYTTA